MANVTLDDWLNDGFSRFVDMDVCLFFTFKMKYFSCLSIISCGPVYGLSRELSRNGFRMYASRERYSSLSLSEG